MTDAISNRRAELELAGRRIFLANVTTMLRPGVALYSGPRKRAATVAARTTTPEAPTTESTSSDSGSVVVPALSHRGFAFAVEDRLVRPFARVSRLVTQTMALPVVGAQRRSGRDS